MFTPYETTGGSLRNTITAICERDPPRPSDVALPAFRKQLRGELDDLILKAMAKDPAHRYSSVEQLADDIDRYQPAGRLELKVTLGRIACGSFYDAVEDWWLWPGYWYWRCRGKEGARQRSTRQESPSANEPLPNAATTTCARWPPRLCSASTTVSAILPAPPRLGSSPSIKVSSTWKLWPRMPRPHAPTAESRRTRDPVSWLIRERVACRDRLAAGRRRPPRRAATAGHRGHGTWKIWMFAASSAVTSVYGVGGDPPTRGILEWQGLKTTVDYPPVALYELGLAGRVFRWFDPAFSDGVALTVATKLPGLACGIGLTALLWWAVRRHAGSPAAAHWGVARLLGQPGHHPERRSPRLPRSADDAPGDRDAGAAARRVAGAGRRRICHRPPDEAAGDPAGADPGPSPPGASARIAEWGLAAAGGALATALVVLPFALVGALPNMWLAFGSFYARRNILSGNAANLWWIVTYVLRALYQIPQMGVLGAYLAPVRRILAISTLRRLACPTPGRSAQCSYWAPALGGSGACATPATWRATRSAPRSSSTPSSCSASASMSTT